ncbi:temperature-induced lipocalin, putative [Ichthyophthirius multifiliis]|uniref:Temperature-induced lipocalin, putative n=1 Tax=Ichthyophthirius multifiliis TaxID=5932 RepID=G0R3Y8_ICHMU|nr:temperature-induced lipocalin, putative [Ichthyophthirius multifiliis]EGR27819.1 temperature-induced lipocalin, putative [Ichthyophthirius multifiliis]|eukprot:XP_004027164.1 temperature-induced lipocalin, putative [Ichthyophthirius multifiliis]
MMFIVFCLILNIGYIYSISGNKGACKSGNYTDFDLDINKYLGKWYSAYVSESFSYIQRTDICAFANYLLNSDETLNIHNEGISQEGKHKSAYATGKIVSPGKFKIKFSIFQLIPANYEVVYVNNGYDIAAVVGCNGFYEFGSSDVWILVRDYNYDENKVLQVISKVKELGFDVSDIVKVNTSGCSTY